MTVVVDRQYRAVTDIETDTDDALTYAAVRELGWGMNNYKAWVSGQPLITSASPIIDPGPYLWKAAGAATTLEQVIHRFAPRPLPLGYDRIHFQIGGILGGGATGAINFALYASTRPYAGPQQLNTNFLGPVWDNTYITINDTSHQVPAGTTDLVAVRNEALEVYLTLTSIRTVGTDSGYLTAIQATARTSL